MKLPGRCSKVSRLLGVLGGAGVAILAGCASEPRGVRPGPLTALSPADFAAPVEGRPAAVAQETPAPAIEDTTPPTAAPAAAAPERVSEGVYDLTTSPGGIIASDAPQVAPAGRAVLVDAKIGDINGKPIFASTFFDRGTPAQTPLGPRLAAEARRIGEGPGRITEAEWRRNAGEAISVALEALIEDELLRAEALSSFTPEQKQGFLAFMQRLQADTQRQYGASRERLNQELQEREGLSADQYFSQQEQRELVRFQLTEKIFRRVNVTWRDIAQAYDRSYDQFNPPPSYKFRMITVPSAQAADVESLKSELASGKPFGEIAKSPLNRWKSADGGLETRQIKGEQAKGEYFNAPGLNAAARTLAVGQTAGPIELGTSLAWLHLEAIDETHIGLYEAQLALESYLRERKAAIERQKYMQRLIDRAVVTDRDQMRQKLIKIAEQRYLAAG